MTQELIQVDGLRKSFRIGLRRKQVNAVQGISFRVKEGDIFGFLGPNGAGKTTTIKMLTGLIAPSGGSARIFGYEVPSTIALREIGFLPENPYVYPFLTPTEFVEMCGQLSGLSGKSLRARTREVLERTGVLYAADRPARRLSKGMLQRTALAAALVADPRLLILDEPMSGLDPIGRKEVKDLILDERAKGRTIFFSTHILGDVETLCDRVTILRRGKVVVEGKLDQLLKAHSQRVGVVLGEPVESMINYLKEAEHPFEVAGGRLRVELPDANAVARVLALAVEGGVRVEEVVPRHETLEDLFVREAIGSDSSDASKVAAG